MQSDGLTRQGVFANLRRRRLRPPLGACERRQETRHARRERRASLHRLPGTIGGGRAAKGPRGQVGVASGGDALRKATGKGGTLGADQWHPRDARRPDQRELAQPLTRWSGSSGINRTNLTNLTLHPLAGSSGISRRRARLPSTGASLRWMRAWPRSMGAWLRWMDSCVGAPPRRRRRGRRGSAAPTRAPRSGTETRRPGSRPSAGVGLGVG